VELSEADHYDHYIGFSGSQGPFGATCRNRQEAKAEHQGKPLRPAAPHVDLEREMHFDGIQWVLDTKVHVRWKPVGGEPPVLEYSIEIASPGNAWREIAATEDTSLELRESFHSLPSEFTLRLRARNVNGLSKRGAASKLIQLKGHRAQSAPAFNVTESPRAFNRVDRLAMRRDMILEARRFAGVGF